MARSLLGKVLAWLGQLATFTLAWTLALLIAHLLGFPWRA